MTTPALRVTTSLLLTAALVLMAATSPALAAKANKKKKDTGEPAPSAVIEVLKGDKARMANSKLAERVVRIDDHVDDQFTNAGDRAVGAPGYSDLESVYVASTQVPGKLLAKMAKDFPAGTVGSFYGSDADWAAGKPAIFVAAKLADKRPAGAPGQQLEIGVDGNGATPVQAGSEDPLLGLERFSLSGLFNNGAWTSGTTDVRGREPGGEIEWYNATSGNFGFYDPKRATYYVIMPRPKDAGSVSVALRTSTDAGEVVDRLELPDGGSFVDLQDPSGGFKAASGLDPLSCRALETFSDAITDPAPTEPGATLIRYTVGAATSDAAAATKLLGPALDAVGTIPMVVTEVGADPAETEPLRVDGQLTAAAGGTAVSLTLEVPPGQWSFAPAEGAQVTLADGQPLIDHLSLTGTGGVLTGPGLDGIVAGDPACTPVDAAPAADAATATAGASNEPAEASPTA